MSTLILFNNTEDYRLTSTLSGFEFGNLSLPGISSYLSKLIPVDNPEKSSFSILSSRGCSSDHDSSASHTSGPDRAEPGRWSFLN